MFHDNPAPLGSKRERSARDLKRVPNGTWENLLKGMEFRPEHFIIYVSGKYPRLWALKEAGPNDVRRWYNFGALAPICTIALGFREISELPDWVLNAVLDWGYFGNFMFLDKGKDGNQNQPIPTHFGNFMFWIRAKTEIKTNQS
ncbi:hypothetical protein ACS0TY_032107 [Phlomoides rotata]